MFSIDIETCTCILTIHLFGYSRLGQKSASHECKTTSNVFANTNYNLKTTEHIKVMPIAISNSHGYLIRNVNHLWGHRSSNINLIDWIIKIRRIKSFSSQWLLSEIYTILLKNFSMEKTTDTQWQTVLNVNTSQNRSIIW